MNIRNVLAVGIAVFFCASCGGGGGSSPGSSDQANTSGQGGGDQDGGDGGDGNTVTPIAGTFNCSTEIDESFLSSLETGILPNISSGCDYVITESMQINAISMIEPGVTIALAGSIEVELSNQSLAIDGTATNPIIFQAVNAATPWGKITLESSDLSLAHALFADGGASTLSGFGTETYNDAAVEVVFGGIGVTGSSIVNTTFSNSRSSGLLFGDRQQIGVFSGNQFSDNTIYSVILGGSGVEDVINSISENTFSGSTSQPVLIDFERADTRSEDVVFHDIGVPYMFANLTPSRGDLNNNDLLFMDGSEMWFAPGSGLGGNTIYVMGTIENPVVFSGIPESVNEWVGIEAGPDSILRHFRIIGGGLGEGTDGSSLFLASTGFNLPDQSNGFTIEHGSIEDSQGVGIKCSSSGNTFVGNLSALSISNAAFGAIDPICQVSADLLAPTVEDTESETVAFNGYPVHASECSNIMFNERILTPLVLENGPSACDYLIVGSNQLQSNVTIEAGTTIIFERSAELDIDVVQAMGTEDAPIVFRGNNLVSGYWKGLSLSGNASSLEHVSLYDAGALDGIYLFTEGANIEEALSDAVNLRGFTLGLFGLETSLVNVNIDRSSSVGMYFAPGATVFDITDSRIGSVGTFSGYLGPAIAEAFAVGVTVDVDDPTMFSNGVFLTDRALREATYQALRTTPSNLSDSFDVLGQLELTNIGVPWVITEMVVEDGALILQEGTDIRALYGIMLDNATLQINGSESAPVLLSGSRDDPADLAWGGITQRSETSAEIDMQITGMQMNGADAGLTFLNRSGTTVVSNSIIANGLAGIRCGNFIDIMLSLENVVFDNLADFDIDPDCGL